METIAIPALNLNASRVCLGTWAIGGKCWGRMSEYESLQTILSAFNTGINIVDTAPIYGRGKSEELIGKAIGQFGSRDKIIISNKVGLSWDCNDNVYRDSSAATIELECNKSLKRLNTDYIDICQVHWPDKKTNFAETANALLKLQLAGKIRMIGVSNFNKQQILEFSKFVPVNFSQAPFNLFEQSITHELLPFCETKNIITLAYGALCRGFLAGKISLESTFLGDDIRNEDPKFILPLRNQYINAADALSKFAATNYNKKLLPLAIRWILDRGNTIAIWGARRPSQLDELESIFNWNINKTDMQEIYRILADNIAQATGVEFMAPPEE